MSFVTDFMDNLLDAEIARTQAEALRATKAYREAVKLAQSRCEHTYLAEEPGHIGAYRYQQAERVCLTCGLHETDNGCGGWWKAGSLRLKGSDPAQIKAGSGDAQKRRHPRSVDARDEP